MTHCLFMAGSLMPPSAPAPLPSKLLITAAGLVLLF